MIILDILLVMHFFIFDFLFGTFYSSYLLGICMIRMIGGISRVYPAVSPAVFPAVSPAVRPAV